MQVSNLTFTDLSVLLRCEDVDSTFGFHFLLVINSLDVVEADVELRPTVALNEDVVDVLVELDAVQTFD